MRLNILIFLLAFSSALSASDREDKIRTLMQVQGTIGTFQQQIDMGREQGKEHGQALLAEMLMDFEPPPEYRDEITEVYNTYVDTLADAWSADELVAVWGKFYAASFSDSELDELIRHYSSPLAQKEIVASREALNNYSEHFAESSVQLQAEALRDFQDALQEILTRCECSKDAQEPESNSNETENTVESNLESLLEQAREQKDFGDYAESLESYLTFLDESRGTSYAGARLSYVAEELWKMGENYPPAIDTLRDLRDEAEQRMFSSRATRDDIFEWSSLSKRLDGGGYIISVYDQLRFRGTNDPVVLSSVLEQNWNNFIEAGRYADLVSLAFQKWGNLDYMISTVQASENANAVDAFGEYMVHEYAGVFEVFLATENTDEAHQISEVLLSQVKSGVAYHALIEAAKAAGKYDTATSLLAEAEVNLSEEEYKIARDGRPRQKGCDGIAQD